jgi:hypothetical protein
MTREGNCFAIYIDFVKYLRHLLRITPILYFEKLRKVPAAAAYGNLTSQPTGMIKEKSLCISPSRRGE